MYKSVYGRVASVRDDGSHIIVFVVYYIGSSMRKVIRMFPYGVDVCVGDVVIVEYDEHFQMSSYMMNENFSLPLLNSLDNVKGTVYL